MSWVAVCQMTSTNNLQVKREQVEINMIKIFYLAFTLNLTGTVMLPSYPSTLPTPSSPTNLKI